MYFITINFDSDEVVPVRQTRKKRYSYVFRLFLSKNRDKVDLPTLPDGTIDLSRALMRDIIRAHDKYGKPTKAQAEREVQL